MAIEAAFSLRVVACHFARLVAFAFGFPRSLTNQPVTKASDSSDSQLPISAIFCFTS
jgi:hypothetical protein